MLPVNDAAAYQNFVAAMTQQHQQQQQQQQQQQLQHVQDAVAAEVEYSVAKQPRGRGKKGRGKNAAATPPEQPVTLPAPASIPETIPAQEVVAERKERGRRNTKKTEASDAGTPATPPPPSGSNPTKGKALLSLLRSSPEN
jgi:hypothetical protein